MLNNANNTTWLIHPLCLSLTHKIINWVSYVIKIKKDLREQHSDRWCKCIRYLPKNWHHLQLKEIKLKTYVNQLGMRIFQITMITRDRFIPAEWGMVWDNNSTFYWEMSLKTRKSCFSEWDIGKQSTHLGVGCFSK